MKFKVTYEMTMTLPGEASAVKDLDPERVAEALHGILDDYEYGRYDLARETLEALTRNSVEHAAYRALTDVLFQRYGNRLMKPRPGAKHRTSVASLIARKRLEGITGYSHVDSITVQKVENE